MPKISSLKNAALIWQGGNSKKKRPDGTGQCRPGL
jgi:hypothetical protein